ncbi:MAG: prephenate dehydratase [Planctomycetota bacterium]|nr:MAG: prephenate dehydratase [Planctomycetota bacterium]
MNNGNHVVGETPPVALDVDALDRQLVALLNRRAAAALAGGLAAADRCSENAAPAPLVEANQGPLTDRALQAIFRELASGIRALAGPLTVAYLGPEYTYSHLAAIARFGQSAELAPVATIAAVFEEVERGQASYGVVPIENSTDGRVADSLECLARHHAHALSGAGGDSGRAGKVGAVPQICGEIPLRIHHCLLGSGSRNDIRRVFSKPQALSQCRNWLSVHLPQVTLEPASSTTEAAALAAAHRDTAAIAAEQAAVNHGLTILARNIEDNPDNITRFAVISSKAAERTGRDKTALAFEAPHKPGALADAMAIFKRHQLNLTWIESFPIPQARGRYLFFVEFQGHASDETAVRAIAALQKKSLRLVVLGSYAEAEVVE